MKRSFLLILSVVLCPIIVVGYVAGTKQEAGADNGPNGKYVLSVDPTQYIELRSDGTCLVGAREYTPSGQTGKLELLSGTYEMRGDIVTLKVIVSHGTLVSEFRLEDNTLVPQKMKRVPRGLEGAKYIRR